MNSKDFRRRTIKIGPTVAATTGERGVSMNSSAVITGASSGIGAEFARVAAMNGLDLTITGRRRDKLEAVAERIRREQGRRVETMIVELADRDQRTELCAVLAQRDDIELLVNNAGFGVPGTFDEEAERQLDMLDVHARAPLELIKAVLPQMKRRGSGAIINVASVASFFPLPKASVYASSKAFLVVFSEALAMELSAFGIGVQALCPGMTRTDFHDRMGVSGRETSQRNLMGWKTPESVVAGSFAALRRGRVVYIPGIGNNLLVRTLSHLPRRLYYRLVQRLRSAV